MAVPKATSLYQRLLSLNPSTVSIKFVTGEVITDAPVISIQTNGIEILDTVANLVRFCPEWGTAYISTEPPVATA